MPDGYFNSLPIPRKNVDLAGMQQNIANLQSGLAQEILDRTAADATKANKTTKINGKSLEADRVIYAQDIPSKNLLPNMATTQTINGVTFTVNADGSVTANGTATGSDANFNIIATASGALDFLPSGDYILSGCPSGGSWNSYNLQIENAGTWVGDNGDGGAFTRSSSGEDRVRIRVATGTTVNNLTFYPMIRLASDSDPTYVPYAKTNVELTKRIRVKKQLEFTVTTGVKRFTLSELGIRNNDVLFVQNYYRSSGLLTPIFTTQINAGNLYLYVRNGDGTLPADGTIIIIDLLIITP